MDELADLDGGYWVEKAGSSPARTRTTLELDRPPPRPRRTMLFLDLTEARRVRLVPYDALARRRDARHPQACARLRGPSREEMREILDLIDAELAAGGVVYLHRYRGVGRTGTVVGCQLVRHGTPPEHAVEAIGRLRANIRPCATGPRPRARSSAGSSSRGATD